MKPGKLIFLWAVVFVVTAVIFSLILFPSESSAIPESLFIPGIVFIFVFLNFLISSKPETARIILS